LLEIGDVTGLFRAWLYRWERQIHLVLHGAGNTVQLPDELFELFRTAKVQVAVPEKADRQHDEHGQTDSQGGQYDGDKQGVGGCGHGASKGGDFLRQNNSTAAAVTNGSMLAQSGKDFATGSSR
jgi:hypothetical protein